MLSSSGGRQEGYGMGLTPRFSPAVSPYFLFKTVWGELMQENDMTVGGRMPLLDCRTLNEGQEYVGFFEGVETITNKKGESFQCFYLNTGNVSALVTFFSLSSKTKYKVSDLLGKKVKLVVSQKKFLLTPL